jgi:hypothetical protein
LAYEQMNEPAAREEVNSEEATNSAPD